MLGFIIGFIIGWLVPFIIIKKLTDYDLKRNSLMDDWVDGDNDGRK
jgi:hypothetical protein